MGLCFQRQNGVDIPDLKKIRFLLCCRGKLLNLRPDDKCHIVFISRHQIVRILFRSSFDQGKEALFHLFSVDDESAVENFMTAMFRIYLGKTVNLRIGQFASYFSAYFFKIFHLIITECQPFIHVVCSDVFHLPDRFGPDRNFKNIFIQTVV